MRKCPVCGMDVPDGSDFCPSCGALLTSDIRSMELDEKVIEIDVPPADDVPKNNTWKKYLKNPVFIGAAVLIAVLIGINIFQFASAKGNRDKVSSLEQKTASLEKEKASLKNENDTLQQSVEGLEAEIAEMKTTIEGKDKEIRSLEDKKKQLDSTVSGLESKVSSLEQSESDLESKYNNLSNSTAKATETYKAIKEFQYGTKSSKYFSSAEIVIVKVGETKKINVTFTPKVETTVSFSSNNDYVTGAWGKDWSNGVCTWSVTGNTEGTTVFTFTNEYNSDSFKVLVIVVPK